MLIQKTGRSVLYMDVKDDVLCRDCLPGTSVHQLERGLACGERLQSEPLDSAGADPCTVNGELAVDKLKLRAVDIGFPLVSGSRIALQPNNKLLANTRCDVAIPTRIFGRHVPTRP